MYQNSGTDLRVLPDVPFDFAFSFIVFQHIPSKEIIAGYVREVSRLLRPGALFKFQAQGAAEVQSADTWLGAAFSVEEMTELALCSGFEPKYHHGEGTQYFWLWFFKDKTQ